MLNQPAYGTAQSDCHVRTRRGRSPLLRHRQRVAQVQHGRAAVAAVREQEGAALRLPRPRLPLSRACRRAALQLHAVQRQACAQPAGPSLCLICLRAEGQIMSLRTAAHARCPAVCDAIRSEAAFADLRPPPSSLSQTCTSPCASCMLGRAGQHGERQPIERRPASCAPAG